MNERAQSEWDRLQIDMRGESLGAGKETCMVCRMPYYDAGHLANKERPCKGHENWRKDQPMTTLTHGGPSTASTICHHCGMRRATHVRRHHGNGPKGTVWYCRTPIERCFEPSPFLDAPPDLAPKGDDQ